MQTLVHAISGATATTTSQPVNIEGAKKVTLRFVRTNHSAGKTVFSVSASIDGTTYLTFNKLIANAANLNSETLARVASYDTGTANADAFYSMDLQHDTYKAIKVTATETTDGTHDAWVYVEY